VIAEHHTSDEIFTTLAGEWNDLLSPTRSTSFFMRTDWQRIWWKYLHEGDLSVVTVRDDGGTLRGVGSWFIAERDGQRVINIVGSEDVTDYLEIVAAPGDEVPVFDTLLDFLLSGDAPAWDSIELCNVPEDSPTRTLFPDLAGARGLIVAEEVQEVCPVIDLPGSFEDYLGTIDKKQRHELRRKRRRAEAQDISWYTVGPGHDLEAEIADFLDLMALSTPEKAAFLEEPGHREFFHEMGRVLFDQGLLDLLFLTVEGQKAAAMWQFAYRDRMMLYNSGLNPSDFAGLSPGIVLSTYSIEAAIEKGLARYDFLRGDETYKYRMGARDTSIYRISVHR